jgi:multidrug resistance efflux pump
LSARARWERLKNGYREEDKRQALADAELARADLKLAREEHGRASRLGRDRIATRAELDTAQATLDRCRARLASAEAKLDMMKAGPRAEEIEEARAEHKRLEFALGLLRATKPADIEAARAREAEARAALAEAEVNLAEATVRAEEPCVVELVSVRPGDLVTAGQSVARALRAGDLWVKTYVPETELGKLRLNQEAEVSMDGCPVRLKGRVVHIGTDAEYTPRNVQTVDERKHQMFGIRVKVSDPEGRFKSGMAAEVFITLAE